MRIVRKVGGWRWKVMCRGTSPCTTEYQRLALSALLAAGWRLAERVGASSCARGCSCVRLANQLCSDSRGGRDWPNLLIRGELRFSNPHVAASTSGLSTAVINERAEGVEKLYTTEKPEGRQEKAKPASRKVYGKETKLGEGKKQRKEMVVVVVQRKEPRHVGHA